MVEKKFVLTLTPKKVIYFLVAIMIFLIIAHVIGVFMKYVFGHNSVYGLVPFFDLDQEQNPPTYFSCCLLLISCILFFIIWKLRKEDKRQWIWLLLSVILFFLSLDEFASIHERFSHPAKFGLPYPGFHAAWVIPWGIGVVIVLILVIPFFRQIDKKIRHWFGLSVFVYLSGAAGFELIGNWYISRGPCDIVCGFITMFEESLEMTGAIMLIYSLLILLQNTCNKFEIVIPSKNSRTKTIDNH